MEKHQKSWRQQEKLNSDISLIVLKSPRYITNAMLSARTYFKILLLPILQQRNLGF